MSLVAAFAIACTALAQKPNGIRSPEPAVKEDETVGVRELYSAETILYSAPPPLVVLSGIKCDLKRNIFLVYSDAPQAVLNQPDGISTLPISKISLDTKEVVRFPVPSIPEHQHVLRYDFNVDSSGKLYALLSAAHDTSENKRRRADYYIIKYKDDGTPDSFVNISEPPGVRINAALQFAVFGDGHFLVVWNALRDDKLETFTSVFDRGGNFVTDLKAPEDVDAASSRKSTATSSDAAPDTKVVGGFGKKRTENRRSHAMEGGESRLVGNPSGAFAVSAPDGNLNVLGDGDPQRLYAISSSGEVFRQVEIKPPAQGLSPIQLAMAGGDRLFIQFGHIATGQPGETLNAGHPITVLDPYHGRVTDSYVLAAGESESNLAACASSPYNFLFVGTSEDNKLKVVRYTPRVF